MDIGKVVAKALGYAIVLGSLTLKVPQIYNIVSSKRADGISPFSFYVEVYVMITSVAYNILQKNPFSSYGDNVSILFQNIILVAVLWFYMKPRPSSLHVTFISTTFIVLLAVSMHLPHEYQSLLVLVGIPLLITGRVPQIVSNFSNKSTGQLSGITTVLQTAGFNINSNINMKILIKTII